MKQKLDMQGSNELMFGAELLDGRVLLWYCASSPPESPVSALATHRPIVIIIPVLILDARTISGLSPVARMESPSLVFKNREINTPTSATITAATISLYQVPPIASFAQIGRASCRERV